jgi:hypothetical protein
VGAVAGRVAHELGRVVCERCASLAIRARASGPVPVAALRSAARIERAGHRVTAERRRTRVAVRRIPEVSRIVTHLQRVPEGRFSQADHPEAVDSP